MNKTITVVVIGYGGMGSRHAQQMNKVGGMTVKGAYDILPTKTAQIRQDGFYVYPDFDAVLQDSEVQLVVIATPNQEHMRQSISAMRAGKHVVCEKPVTLGSDELEQIIKVKEETGRQFIVHQNRRWDEDYVTIRDYLRTGKIGSAYHFESRVMGSRGVPGDWRQERACGGGMLYDWGVHLIDQMLCMVPGNIARLSCYLSYQLGLEVDDGFYLFLYFENGVTALLQAATWNFEMMPRWYVNGTKGTLKIDKWHHNGSVTRLKKELAGDAIPVVTAAGITKTMAPREDDSMEQSELPLVTGMPLAFYENVRDVLLDGGEPIVTPAQVMRSMKVIEAARTSAELGQMVDCKL